MMNKRVCCLADIESLDIEGLEWKHTTNKALQREQNPWAIIVSVENSNERKICEELQQKYTDSLLIGVLSKPPSADIIPHWFSAWPADHYVLQKELEELLILLMAPEPQEELSEILWSQKKEVLLEKGANLLI